MRRPAPASFVILGDAVRLASGAHVTIADERTWHAVLDAALGHRLAPLAWLRAGAAIQAAAPGTVVGRWRAAYATASAIACVRGAQVAETIRELDAAGVFAVVLKGLPLAQRLHGDAAARVSLDTDLFVPAEQRGTARRALLESGWTLDTPAAPRDESYCRPSVSEIARVELHSTLGGERLRHLRVPPPTVADVTLASGECVPSFVGLGVAGYLAAHLAAHSFPPLLWWLDLAAEWASLGPVGRVLARRAAREAGFAAYLRWAMRRVEALARIVDGDDGALAALGFHATGRAEVHPVWRHLACAPGMAGRGHVVREWVRPSWAPRRDGGPVQGTARRLRVHGRALLGVAGPLFTEAARGDALLAAPGTAPARIDGPTGPAPIDARTLMEAATTVTSVGGRLSIRLTGLSMAPTMRPGDRVVLGQRPARRGDIVLLEIAGAPVVHRILAVGHAQVRTCGDACRRPDPVVPPDAVRAVVLASEREGRWTAHVPTLEFGTWALARGAALRWRARVRRSVLATLRRVPTHRHACRPHEAA